MLHFFRRIRQGLLKAGQFQKYLFYAIGEILLVVMGILIALQINNWNENRKSRLIEQKLLSELKENLETNVQRFERDLRLELRSIASIRTVVAHLDNKLPYHDSLIHYFGTAHFAPDIVLSTSGFEAIKSKGFEIIEKDALRKAIMELFDVTYAYMLSETIRLENQFWPSSMLPITHTHFRHPDQDARGLIPIDYNALLKDKKYINVITNRLHFRKRGHGLKTEALGVTRSVIKLIEEELAVRKGMEN